MKIICAGLGKTGTKTIAEALRIIGYNVHDVFEQFHYDKELWDKILDNTATIQDYQRILGNVDAVMDWPAAAVWENIMEAFPDAKVILTVRSSEDEWYESMKNHFEVTNKFAPTNEMVLYLFHLLFAGPLRREFHQLENAFIPPYLGVPRMFGKPRETFLRSRYRQHNLYVKSICPSQKLLVYNVKDGWKPLCEFLNVEIPHKPFPIENVRSEIIRKYMNKTWKYDCGLQRKIEKQVIFRLGTLLIIIISIVFFIFF
uniref:uncharacterized protein LOC120344580 n=1 Tax=Styela clava TaxID=7725 RepID=UPI00193AAEEA|nr:uncharacterized protein LOC120344580 [Styela clava]